MRRLSTDQYSVEKDGERGDIVSGGVQLVGHSSLRLLAHTVRIHTFVTESK